MKKLSLFFFVVAVGLVALILAGSAQAGLTISNESGSVWGNKRIKIFDVAFDSSYAYGGESLTKASRGMSAIDQVLIMPKDGYTFVYDETNQKVKVYAPAPAIVYDEPQTIVSGTSLVTLDYPPAYIISISQASTNVKITDAGATLSTDDCQPYPAFTAGVRGILKCSTTLTGVVYVTYVTQAWKEVWDNLVQGETVTLTSNGGHLANNAIAIQSFRLETASGTSANSGAILDKDDTVATLEVTLDWTPTEEGEETGVTCFATDAITSIIASYIKKPSAGFLLNNWVEEETATIHYVAGTTPVAQLLDYPVLLWGYAGEIPINTKTTQRIINQGGTAGPAEANPHWFCPSGTTNIEESYAAFQTAESTAMTTATYIKGRLQDIPFLVPLEVRSTQNLSALTGVQVIMIGR